MFVTVDTVVIFSLTVEIASSDIAYTYQQCRVQAARTPLPVVGNASHNIDQKWPNGVSSKCFTLQRGIDAVALHSPYLIVSSSKQKGVVYAFASRLTKVRNVTGL